RRRAWSAGRRVASPRRGLVLPQENVQVRQGERGWQSQPAKGTTREGEERQQASPRPRARRIAEEAPAEAGLFRHIGEAAPARGREAPSPRGAAPTPPPPD